MTDEDRGMVTNADVRSLAAKLKGLHALLTPPEQTLLDAVLRRAATATSASEVTGYAWAVSFNPFPYLDDVATEVWGKRQLPGS